MNAQMEREIAAAKAILTEAKRTNRDLDDREKRQVEQHLSKARDQKLAGELDRMMNGGSGGEAVPAKKLSALVKDSLRKMGAKDLTATPGLITPVDFVAGPSALQGVIGPRIFGSFPQRRVTGGSVRYLRQTQAGSAVEAAEVAPGAEKPVATWDIENIDEDLPIFALISPTVANVVLRDGGSEFERFVDQVLSASVYKALDEHSFSQLNTAAIAAGQTQAYATSVTVTLRKAITMLEVDGWEATHAFVNPAQHESLALATDSTGSFYFGGPSGEASVPKAWSAKLVSSNAVTAGVAIVVAAPVAAVGVLREDVELAVDSVSGFTTNESRLRAEMRALLAVTTPSAVVSVDLTP